MKNKALWVRLMAGRQMNKRITIAVCILASSLISIAETNTAPVTKSLGLTGKVLRKEIRLSEVGKLPSSAEMTNVVINA